MIQASYAVLWQLLLMQDLITLSDVKSYDKINDLSFVHWTGLWII